MQQTGGNGHIYIYRNNGAFVASLDFRNRTFT